MPYTIILLLGVTAVGSAGLMARVGLVAGLTALDLALWRLTVAAILLGVWRVVGRSKAEPLSRSQILCLVASGVFLSIHFETWFVSLEYLPVAQSTLIVSTTPIWAGLVGLFVPALRPSSRFWIGLSIALVGLLIVTSVEGTVAHLKQPVWFGNLMAGLGALAVVPYLLLSQRVQREVGTVQAITWIYTSAAATLWIYALSRGEGTVPGNPTAWASVVGMALIAQLGGHTIFNWSLRHFSAGQVSTALLMEPIVAAILAWILLGEGLEPLQDIGGLILLLGVGITLSRREVDAAIPEPS